MSSHQASSENIMGIAGGIILSTLGTLRYDEIITSAMLGAVGTISSFTITLVCKWIYGKLKKRKGK